MANAASHPAGDEREASQPPLAGLLDVAARDSKLLGLAERVGDSRLHLTGIDQVRPWALAALSKRAPLLVVAASGREAEDLTAELRALIGDALDRPAGAEGRFGAVYFPAWETLPHERLSPGADIVGRRAQAIRHAPDAAVVVTSARGAAQPILQEAPGREPIALVEGEDQPFDELTSRLSFYAYERVDMVARRGQFAVRGGIVDVYPTTLDYPVRVEFWGDEVTEIRQFSVADQRTLDEVAIDAVEVFPARELLVTDGVAERAAKLATEHSGNATLQETLTTIAEGSPTDGMEALIPALADSKLVPPSELLGTERHVVVVSPEKVERRIEDLQETDEEFQRAGWEAAAMGASGPVDAAGLDLEASSYLSLQALRHAAERAGQAWWTLAPTGMMAAAEEETLPLDYEPGPAPRGDLKAIDEAMAGIKKHVANGGRAAFVSPTRGFVKRMADRFLEQSIPARIYEPGEEPAPGEVAVFQALSHAGLVFPRLRPAGDDANGEDAAAEANGSLVVVTETDLTGNRVGDIAGAKRKPAKRRNRVDPLALKKGDFVVHETHGIGRFVKMAERTIKAGEETSRREYVVLEYAPSKRGQPADQLWVPMDSLDLLSKYNGSETPSLSKMGGSDWKNTKKKARAAVREIAGELVNLYAKRQAAPGHAFGPDTPWQRELEDNFPFVETEDQMTAIEEVKADMERATPMDRVVVGDVGYGKTEVAVRAAFKAVQDGTQVAVLVPTTLLAQQHMRTFEERMAGFPVTIRQLSRFNTPAEAKEVIAGLADGTIDIVVGTHRLLQTGVQWKNLGLVVVDEEQRFGVEHKEHIKALRAHVDMLTMSATPIPRTLEMSMSGIREMSTILTPPEDRHPVLTYVGPQEDKQVAAAIRRELLRDGQVFFIHNKVKDIEKRARALRDLVPEARIVVAHGQMTEEALERTVQGFWDREYDVLVCTTIVETGLDIANANTLIVENAHHMGLSQLHQLRGRVGRSRERGYAYFLYPAGQTLSETSYDRLSTIAQNNDLGAGMAVAMKDLEMRGAGNVLGAQQSGHIEGVGFDLYMRLVGEAIDAYRALADGKPVDATDQGPKEIRVDLPVDAHIPEKYINSERLRLEQYRKLAEAGGEDDLQAIASELRDRFGTPPGEVERLFAVARLRLQARAAGVADIGMQGNRIKIHPVELFDSRQVRLKRLYPGATIRAAAQAVLVPMPKAGRTMGSPAVRDEELLQWVADFLSDLFDIDRVGVRGGEPPEREEPRAQAGSRRGERETTSRARSRSRGRRGGPGRRPRTISVGE